ncbi:MAG: hypothetical protein QXR63_04800 [Candidatus Bathyarchaeia archaeon]
MEPIIVAVSDIKGCIYNPDGLEYEKLKQIKAETKSVINYEPGKILKNEALFEQPIEVLLPASKPDVINEKNVDKIQARIVVEAVNIPVKP